MGFFYPPLFIVAIVVLSPKKRFAAIKNGVIFATRTKSSNLLSHICFAQNYLDLESWVKSAQILIEICPNLDRDLDYFN